MIFISDIDGTVTEAAPSPLYQGGNNTKEIVIIAPFSGASVVTVAFELPNGLRSSRGLMSLPESCEMTKIIDYRGGLYTKSGEAMYAWRYKLKRDITAFSGRLGIQFFFTTADGEVIATSKTYHQIHSGTRYLQDKFNVEELSGADVYITRAFDAALSAENSKTEISNLLSPALDGIIAIQEMLIGTHVLYKLNHDKESYTCIGGVNVESLTVADAVNDKPVTRIVQYAFRGYDKLRSIIISANVESIGSEAFQDCAALTDIYVPWSEGAVANAPWGATNATIHYNSQI